MRSFLHNLINADDEPLSINSLNSFIKGESSALLYRQFTDLSPTDLNLEKLAALRPKVHHLLINDKPDNVFVKTHSFLGQSFDVPTITPEVTAGAIYIVRNPLDICISLANHIGKSIDEVIEWMGKDTVGESNEYKVMELWRSWSANVLTWTKYPQKEILVVRYEDLQEDKAESFGAVVKSLGLDFPESKIQKAIKFSSFEIMRNQEDKERFKESSPHSRRFFRKGIKGEWKEKLTKDQVDRLVEDHYEQMKLFGYLPDQQS